MKLEQKRWIILAASCLINLCIGSMYAWSVFANPMAEHLNQINGLTGSSALSAGNLGIVFTVANAVGPVSMVSGGFLNSKFGTKWVIILGGILFGAGLLSSGFAMNPVMLSATFGIGCGLGMGFVYGCTITNTVKFFPEKRGLAGGIATASYGLSSVLVPPIANTMIAEFGVVSTFKILGVLFMLIICLCGLTITTCPDGFAPEGWTSTGSLSKKQCVSNKKWKEMLKDFRFYIMLLILMSGAFSGLMIISQTSPMAQNMVKSTPGIAAVMVSVLALFNASGRIIAGFVSDKIGRINTLTFVFILSILGLGLLTFTGEGELYLFAAAVAVVGLCFGSFMGVFPGFTADQFGSENNSINYGIMFIGFAIAGMAGPIIVGKIITATGSYNGAFIVAQLIALAGIGFTLVFRLIERSFKADQKGEL